MMRWLLVATACLSVSCKKEEPPPRPAPVVVPPREPVAAPRSIATRTAFDLVLGREGPVLVWGQPSRLGGGLRVLSLDRVGNAAGLEKEIVAGGSNTSFSPPDAVEIAAAASGGRLGIVWVRRDQTRLNIMATHGDERAEAMAPPVDLGATEMESFNRGTLGATADGGQITILYRGTRGRCAEGQSESCPRFFLRRLGSDDERRSPMAAVPEACPRGVVGLRYVSGTLYASYCAVVDGKPAARVLALQFEPEYAHHEDVHEGCAPYGLGPFEDGVVISSECEGSVRAEKLSHAGTTLASLGERRRVSCGGERPVVHVGEHSQSLEAPRDRLEVLLPSSVAPIGSRAVWTGESIIVASSIGAEVALRRYVCEDGELRRTDHE